MFQTPNYEPKNSAVTPDLSPQTATAVVDFGLAAWTSAATPLARSLALEGVPRLGLH